MRDATWWDLVPTLLVLVVCGGVVWAGLRGQR